MEKKLDQRERRWTTFLAGAPVTNQELYGTAMIMGIEGATESYILADISREGTIRGAIRKKQRQLEAAGFCYCMPRGMEQRDLKKGVYWYEKAVAQGHTVAMFNLGWMYAMGNGVPQDIDRGVKLFRELLDKGDFRGKFSIGRCLVEGIGMEMDKEAGFKLIREAAPKYERARKYLEKHDPDSPENS